LSRLVVNLRQMAIHRVCPTCGVVACMIEGHTCWLWGGIFCSRSRRRTHNSIYFY